MDKPSQTSDADIISQIPAAREQAEQGSSRGMRAVVARYDAAGHVVMLTMSSGHRFGFPVSAVPALQNADALQLAAVVVSPSGRGLHWDAIDVDLDVPGLILEAIGDGVRSQIARIAGASTSDRKAAAARANGARGGRPPIAGVAKGVDAFRTEAADEPRKSTSAKRAERTVSQRENGSWANKKEGAERASSLHDTQGQAEAAARKQLKQSGGGELKVKREDGRILSTDTIAPGKDPRRTKG
jgi:hypothetical protein